MKAYVQILFDVFGLQKSQGEAKKIFFFFGKTNIGQIEI